MGNRILSVTKLRYAVADVGDRDEAFSLSTSKQPYDDESDRTHLTHVAKSMFLCYPVDSLQVGSYPDRPLVGVNGRLTHLEASSHPQRVKNGCMEKESSSRQAEPHCRKFSWELESTVAKKKQVSWGVLLKWGGTFASLLLRLDSFHRQKADIKLLLQHGSQGSAKASPQRAVVKRWYSAASSRLYSLIQLINLLIHYRKYKMKTITISGASEWGTTMKLYINLHVF